MDIEALRPTMTTLWIIGMILGVVLCLLGAVGYFFRKWDDRRENRDSTYGDEEW